MKETEGEGRSCSYGSLVAAGLLSVVGFSEKMVVFEGFNGEGAYDCWGSN